MSKIPHFSHDQLDFILTIIGTQHTNIDSPKSHFVKRLTQDEIKASVENVRTKLYGKH